MAANQELEAGFRPFEREALALELLDEVGERGRVDDAIESIDIGGPAMIRAASKNWANVAVVVDPADYGPVLAAVSSDSLGSLRLGLAAKAFRHTAYYDSMIARYMTAKAGEGTLTETLTLGYKRSASLRYGENPHQNAALYRDPPN